jgi:hypothetical protein
LEGNGRGVLLYETGNWELGRGGLINTESGENTATSPSDGSRVSKPSGAGPIYPSAPFINFRKEIRLVKLHPGRDADQITIELFIVGFESSPSYEALSYVWGSRDSDVTVFVNGTPFNVTANLADALRCLRPYEGSVDRVLWIDALCINQDSIAEKSVQVAMMGDIYRRAAHTVIFLGD